MSLLTAFLFSVAASATLSPVICIDPGHPSEVGDGTKGKFLTEMEFVWDVARKLKPALEADGYTVVMTKKELRQRVDNKDRAAIANKAKADLMLRLHCDYAPGERGFATFIAQAQGTIDGKTGPSQAVIARNKALIGPFHKEVADSFKGFLNDRGARNDKQTAVGKKHGALIGSIYAEVPSILVEICVLNDPKDEDAVRTPEGMKRVVDGLRTGVRAVIQVRARSGDL